MNESNAPLSTSPPTAAPPIIESSTPPRPAPAKVVAWALGIVVLFLAEALLAFLSARMRNPHPTGNGPYLFGYYVGYLLGNLVVPIVAIVGIGLIWPSNRRPYRLLQFSFWVLLGMALLRAADWISVIEKLQK